MVRRLLCISFYLISTQFELPVEAALLRMFKTDQLLCRVVKGDFDSTIRTTIFSGRPLRTLATPYVVRWEKERRYELEELTSKGIRPVEYELERLHKEGTLTDEIEDEATLRFATLVMSAAPSN